MYEPVFGRDAEVARLLTEIIPGCERGFDAFTSIGFGEPLVAGVIYHNWQPEAGVIELSAAAKVRNWLNKRNLGIIFEYPFAQLGCQLCVARIAEDNRTARRIWAALGAKEHVIPRLRGKSKAEVISTLTAEAWGEFVRRHHNGQAVSA